MIEKHFVLFPVKECCDLCCDTNYATCNAFAWHPSLGCHVSEKVPRNFNAMLNNVDGLITTCDLVECYINKPDVFRLDGE